ncbi:SMP-30/gluconolactonase/LRE family protein, partial [Klebsiella pneumoniae]
KAEIRAEGFEISNGLAWTADGATMFHTDSRGPWIDRYDFDVATGLISNRNRIRELDEESGRPDGGACDAEGAYWSAGVSAGVLNRFDR